MNCASAWTFLFLEKGGPTYEKDYFGEQKGPTVRDIPYFATCIKHAYSERETAFSRRLFFRAKGFLHRGPSASLPLDCQNCTG